MERPLAGIWIFLYSSLLMGQSNDTRLDLIFPEPTNPIRLAQVAEEEGKLLVGREMSTHDPLAKKILAELDLPFHRSMIKLNQCSRNLSGNDKGPNVLFLSRTEGGFPRHGLALSVDGELIEYPDLNFVDLVLDEQRVDRGSLDIYSHELGHVMMMNIWKEFPKGPSTKQHVSMGVTDFATAFFEGWGIHFQRLAYENIEEYRDSFAASFDYSRSTGTLWHSNMDKELRLNSVLQNMYIHRKVLPLSATDSLDLEELILLEHTSPLFDSTRLKNAQQMLSCEGVLATLFYRINTNPLLQEHYREADFYNRFLISPLPPDVSPRDLFTPLENVILKSFWIWHALSQEVSAESYLATEFVKRWCLFYPEDREEILKLFISTTVGMSATNELAHPYERMAYYGMVGEIEKYREYSSLFDSTFSEIQERVLSGDLGLDANIGPQIWVENRDFLLRSALWVPDSKRPLMINLNTASEYDLASFPEISLEEARQIVRDRDSKGFFRSMNDVKGYGFPQRQH